MSDCIYRDAVTQMIKKWADGYSYIEVPTEWAEDEVQKIPAADVVEVRHGRWILTIEDWNRWTCPVCSWQKWTDIHVSLGYNYCPNCGAKMDGGVEYDGVH